MEQIKTVAITLLAISLIVSLVLYIRLRRRKVNSNENDDNRTWLSKNWIWLVSIAIAVIWANTFWALLFDQEEGLGDIGKFGDMFGAVNALFSGLAFAGMIYAIVLQSQELGQTNIEMKVQNEMLELQKNELAKTNEMMEQQTKSLELQNKTLSLQNDEMLQTRKEFKLQNETLSVQRFENTFFQLLNLHHELIDKLDCSKIINDEQAVAVGRSSLKFAAEQLNDTLNSKEREILRSTPTDKVTKVQAWHVILGGYSKFYFDMEFELELSHYFRNLYHIFKYVYLAEDIKSEKKKFYATLVRSQLSPDEFFLIYYNSMLAEIGNPKFLFLIREFDIMQNFNNWKVRQFRLHEEVFNDLVNNVQSPFTGDVVNAKPNL